MVRSKQLMKSSLACSPVRSVHRQRARGGRRRATRRCAFIAPGDGPGHRQGSHYTGLTMCTPVTTGGGGAWRPHHDGGGGGRNAPGRPGQACCLPAQREGCSRALPTVCPTPTEPNGGGKFARPPPSPPLPDRPYLRYR